MKRIGIIGLGFMGGVHLKNWQLQQTAQVVAVCNKRPIAGRSKSGNIQAGSDKLNLEGASFYTELADMLSNEELDAVSIALPTYLHKEVSVQCLEAGLHVLCEKPMALTLEDCDSMIAAAHKAGRHLMIAHCIRFWPEYIWVKKAVEEGQYGNVLAADFTRLTHAPAWDSDSWFADTDKSGGVALDLHIHDLDYIQYLFGEPEAIGSQCARYENGVLGHIQTWLDYPDTGMVSATASWMMPESFGFDMAFKVLFERAAAILDGGVLKVYPVDGDVFEPELKAGDGYQGEIEYFAQLISGNNEETLITPEQTRESVRMALESTKL